MTLKRFKLRTVSVMFLLGSTLQPITVSAINSAEIIASALSPNCLQYRISGICFWLSCSATGCFVKNSIKVSHFIPNVVISSYGQVGDNPWSEVSLLGSGVPTLAEGGGANEQKRGQHKSNLQFKNSDVLGHPALASPLYKGFLGELGYACSSSAVALKPYFISTLDALAWRSAFPETLYPEALIPGQRELGSTESGTMWGNIFPRSGFVTQTNSYKAAALVAQRVADIITRRGQSHVYQPMLESRRAGYWPPQAVVENSGTSNHKWQRLVPELSSSCSLFPNNETPIAGDGNYAWALWQPYTCCQKQGQTLLYSIDF